MSEIMPWLWLGLYLAGFVICVVYRRLARGMGLLVLGMGGLTACNLGWRVICSLSFDWKFAVAEQMFYVSQVITVVSFGLILIGLAVAFRDIRHRFQHLERALLAQDYEKENSLPESSVTPTSITPKS
jgi:hypothetical protein